MQKVMQQTSVEMTKERHARAFWCIVMPKVGSDGARLGSPYARRRFKLPPLTIKADSMLCEHHPQHQERHRDKHKKEKSPSEIGTGIVS